MGKITSTISNFSFGNISPEVFGNTDFQGYNNCLMKSVNFTFPYTGGIFKRPGTKFVYETKENSVILSLIFSEDEAYILLFEDGDGQTEDEKKFTGWLKFTDKHGVCKYPNGDPMCLKFWGNLTFEEKKRIKLIKKQDLILVSTPRGLYKMYKDTVIDDTAPDPWAANHSWKWVLDPDPISPETEFKSLNFIVPPMQLLNGNIEKGFKCIHQWILRTNYTEGTTNKTEEHRSAGIRFFPIDYEKNKNFAGVGYEDAVHKPWDSFVNNFGDSFKNMHAPNKKYFDKFALQSMIDEQKMFMISIPTAEGTRKRWWFKITSGAVPFGKTNNLTPVFSHIVTQMPYLIEFVTDTPNKWYYIDCISNKDLNGAADMPDIVKGNFDGADPLNASHCEFYIFKYPILNYAFEAFGRHSGYIEASEFHDKRFFVAKDELVWGSSLEDNLNFQTGDSPTDAIQVSLDLREGSKINWLSAMIKLFIGTSSGIYVVGDASTAAPPITPQNFEVRLLSPYGSSAINPVLTPKSVLFVSSDKKRIHEIYLETDSQTYAVRDRSLTGAWFTKSGIRSHAWQHTPYDMYWCCCEDGSLASFTYVDVAESGITAWGQHQLGGDATVTDTATFKHKSADNLFVLTKRKNKHSDGCFCCLEYITNQYRAAQQEEYKQYYVDCGKTFKKVSDILKINPADDLIGTDARLIGRELKKIKVLQNGQTTDFNIRSADQDGNIRVEAHTPFLINDRAQVLVKLGTISSYRCDRQGQWKSTFVIETPLNFAAGQYKILDSGLTSDGQPLDNMLFSFTRVDNEYSITTPHPVTGVLRDTACVYIQIQAFLRKTIRPFNIEVAKTEAITAGDKISLCDIQGIDKDYFNNKEYTISNVVQNQNTTTLFISSESYNAPVSTDSGTVSSVVREIQMPTCLRGYEVSIFADGEYTGDVTVLPNGIITLDKEYSYVVVGLKYKAELKTLPFFGGSMSGSSVGKKGSITNLTLHMHYSIGGSYGAGDATAQDNTLHGIDYSSITEIGEPVATGETRKLKSGYSSQDVSYTEPKKRCVTIVHDTPTSFNILSITKTMTVED